MTQSRGELWQFGNSSKGRDVLRLEPVPVMPFVDVGGFSLKEKPLHQKGNKVLFILFSKEALA